jgi:hypothetical protein
VFWNQPFEVCFLSSSDAIVMDISDHAIGVVASHADARSFLWSLIRLESTCSPLFSVV